MSESADSNGSGNGNGHHSNGNGRRQSNSNGAGDRWNCTEGQRGFILRIINENNLQKQQAEDLAEAVTYLFPKSTNRTDRGPQGMPANRRIVESISSARAGHEPRFCLAGCFLKSNGDSQRFLLAGDVC